ncbi:MAG: sodium-dependent transporter [Clostridia bacterium]|nr:sodium-dependent transporter [Clostridia bacterium]
MERERLGSRLGFILISAGCAIGCGNVWKFPWMSGSYGGGGFVLIYLLCLALLGLPVLTMEFAIGRAAQASPVRMYRALEKPGQKWHIHGYFAFFGNLCLMAFYSVVTGWMLYYFVQFLLGNTAGLTFGAMLSDWKIDFFFMVIAVVLGFGVLCFKIQKGLERVTKIMMVALLILMIVLVVHSFTLAGAGEGLKFYLVPDFAKMAQADGGIFGVVVGAMNQAFFTLSVGIGSMAIFGSYIGKERSLMGESVNVIVLDTLVAIMAGLIIFPACFTYNTPVGAGPALLFDTMAEVFRNMPGGRIWGSLFFLFMVFAAFSTEISVFENILACSREFSEDIKKKLVEKKGLKISTEPMSRPIGCLICGIVVIAFATTTALGFNVWSGFVPFAEGSGFLDFWDFIVSSNLLPLGSAIFAIFCCNKFGWGWDNFIAEANAGEGLKVQQWMKPIFRFVVPVIVVALYIYGLVTFGWH